MPGIEPVSHAVQPRRQVGREREIGVVRGGDGAVFEVTGPRRTDHLGTVVVAVGDERGRPREPRPRACETRPDLQPLVAVHRRRGHGAERRSVREDAPDEVVGELRKPQSLVVALVEEEVLAGIGVRHVVVDVTAAARAVGERLGHMRRDGPVLLGELAGHHLEEGVAVRRQSARRCRRSSTRTARSRPRGRTGTGPSRASPCRP